MPASSFAKKTASLLARFRRQTPLRGGSLLVTILGDAIAPRGGVVALSSLIELANPFGLTERLVRTAIGRLANEDWVTSQRIGRSSFYSLTQNGRARFAEATQRIYGAAPAEWNGEWTLVIVPPALKKLRDGLREELTWLGFGQLTGGVFAHPTHRDDAILAHLAELESSGKLIVLQRAVVAQASDAQLVAMGWDLEDLARRYRRFIQMFAAVNEGLKAASISGSEEEAFLLRTLLIHEYRKIHLRDPQLPATVLPDNWVGADAHELCRSLYGKVFTASERYLSHAVKAVDGALPAATADIFERFGGLSDSA